MSADPGSHSHAAAADPIGTDDSPLSMFIARFERLRRRAAWSGVAVLVATGLCWTVSGRLYALLALPLTAELQARGIETRLAFTHLTDPFILYLTVSIAGGLALALPLLLGQLFVAFSPGLGWRRGLSLAAFVLVGSLLFAAGVYFCHRVLLPFAVAYLLDVGEGFQQAITIREYLRFSLRLLIALGLAAQLPLVSFGAARIGLVSARDLVRWFPYMLLAIFVLAAWITPPDGASQVLVAVPLVALYGVGVAVAALAGRR